MSDGEGGKKGSMLKMIIMGVLALAVLGGGGYGAMLFLKKKKEAAAAPAEPKKEGDAAAEPPKAEGHGAEDAEDEDAAGDGHGAAQPAEVMVLRPIVNLEGPRRNAFLKVELHILFRDPELGKLAAGDKPSIENSQIRALVLETLSGKTVEEARDLEFRESLRVELKEKLNTKFAPKPPKPGEKEDPKVKKPKKPIKDILIVDWGIQE